MQAARERVNAPSTGESILTGLAGAGNQLLFGLPEFIARGVAGDETVNQWIKDRQKAWEAGSTLGTVGSFLIPGGAIARGLGAGAKFMLGPGSKIAQGLGQFANVIGGATKVGKSPIVQKAIQGMGGALEQGVPRALVQAAGGDLGGAGESLALGTALGGGLGAGLGVLGKGFAAGPGSWFARQAGEATEGAKYATAKAMGLNPRAFKGGLQKMAFGNPRMDNRILEKADEAVEDYIRIGKQRGWFSAAGRDADATAFLRELSGEYDSAINQALQMPQTFKQAAKGVLDGIDEAAKIGLQKGRVYKGSNPFDDVKKQVMEYMTDPQAMARLRNELDGEIGKLQKRFSSLQGEELDRLNALTYAKEGLEDALEAVPQASLVGARPLREIGRDYRVAKMAKDAELTRKISELATSGGGSPTQAKLGIQAMLEGKGPMATAGAVLGASQSNFEDDPMGSLAKIGLGSLGGMALTKAMPSLLNRGKAALLPTLEKLEAAAGKGGQLIPGGLVTPQMMRQAGTVGGVAGAEGLPGEPTQEVAQMEPEAQKSILPALINAIQEKWNRKYAGQLGPASEDNPYFVQLAQSTLDQVMPGGELDPVMAGKLLGQNKEQADSIAKALSAQRAIETNVDITGQMTPGGLFGIGSAPTQEATIAKQLIGGSLGDVAQQAGVTQKQVDQAAQAILSGAGSAQEKKAKLSALIAQYNPQAYAILKQQGVL